MSVIKRTENPRKNRLGRCFMMACTILAGALTAGCGFSLFSDSGTDATLDINKEDYLNLDALTEGTSSSTQGYEVYEVNYGTYENTVTNKKLSIYVPITYTVSAEFDSGEMKFVEFLVSYYQWVEAGDPIATITMETDSITIREAELSLERLKSSYDEAVAEHEESLKDREGPFYLYEKQMQILENEWAIEDLKWEQTEASYKERIASSEKNIKELKANANKTTVTSKYSGYVMDFEDLEAGDELKNGQAMLTLVPSDRVYAYADDSDMQFSFGAKFTAVMTVNRTQMLEYDAEVVSAPARSLYGDLADNRAFFIVDNSLKNSEWRNSYYVDGVISQIDNVLIIPIDAVEVVNDIPYVTILKDDGSLLTSPFVEGGHNRNWYWVFSGIEAGTKVIIK